MIDKNELLKLLPKLIREDDEIKGAIITALSGVVATKEDIASLIEHSNRRFEEVNKRFEQIDKRFEEVNEEYTGIHIKVMQYISLIFPMLIFLINIGVLIIVWVGGNQVINGDLTVGGIVAFSNYLMTL